MLSELSRQYPDLDGKRHFLISEVTHMGGGDVCVAGVDLQRQQIVRPLQWNHRNWPVEFSQKGLVPGRIVRQRIRRVQEAHGFPHQTEDTQLSDPMELLDRALSDSELFRVLEPMADASVRDIFGENVLDKKYVVDGTMCRSLGSAISSARSAQLYVSHERPRLVFTDSEQEYDLPITDLRIWDAYKSGRQETVERALSNAAARAERLLIRTGLARGWSGSSGEYDPKRCYLQVNGVVFERDPRF